MRLAIVGPTYPHQGGIAQHTTELAHRLAGAGHEVDLVSWSEQYPRLLYPGQRVRASDLRASDLPELPLYPRTRYPLSWRRPDGWWREAVRLRGGGYDGVVLVVVTPVQAPAYLVMEEALRRGRAGGAPPMVAPRIVALCHNVLPHEPRFFDRPLIRAVLSRVDAVLVHSAEQAALAGDFSAAPAMVAALPPHLPGQGGDVVPAPAGVGRRLLFFGIVRPYKGLDVLLRALAEVPDVALTVAGEFWGGTGRTEALVAELGLTGRVTLRPGYVPDGEIPGLFAGADALVLPYRSGTASQNVWLAHSYGLPVIATRAGTLGDAVRDRVDGVLCRPGEVADLAAGIRWFYQPGTPERLRAAVPPVNDGPAWTTYTTALTNAVLTSTATHVSRDAP